MIEILNYRHEEIKRSKYKVEAIFDLKFPSGYILRDCLLLSRNGQRRVHLPSFKGIPWDNVIEIAKEWYQFLSKQKVAAIGPGLDQ